MSNHLFNYNQVDFTKEPMFFGESRNIARLDLAMDPTLEKAIADANSRMWFPGEFQYSEDVPGYVSMNLLKRKLYLKNFKFQTTADSLVARSVIECFLPTATSPFWESWLFSHAFFENNIHSQTYADIMKAMPDDTKEMFDSIIDDENIMQRFKILAEAFEALVLENCKMVLAKAGTYTDYDEERHKQVFFIALFALLRLEAIDFKLSFIVSFSFREHGLMNNSIDAIAKIALDELSSHYATFANIINRLRSNSEWAYMFEDKDIMDKVYNLFEEGFKSDKLWIDYIFEDMDEVNNINKSILLEYSKYNINSVLRAVGLSSMFDDNNVFNSCKWADKYFKRSNIQTAQKEKVNNNYSLGIVDSMTSEDWDSIKNEY